MYRMPLWEEDYFVLLKQVVDLQFDGLMVQCVHVVWVCHVTYTVNELVLNKEATETTL